VAGQEKANSADMRSKSELAKS